MKMDENNNGKTRKPLTFTEKVKNVCLGLGAMTGLILGVVANVKGEPEAQEAKDKGDEIWKTLKGKVDKQSKALNSQSEAIEKLSRRVIFLQAHEAGFNAGKMYAELQAANSEIAKLRNKGRNRKIATDLAIMRLELADRLKRRKAIQKKKIELLKGQKTLPRMAPLPFSPGAKK
jgi:hypothetical protein